MSSVSLAACAWVPVTAAALAFIPQQQVFRSGVTNVAVYATVTDRTGQLVRNLGRNDFQVLDDGRVQELTVFNNGQQPITAMLLVDTSASMAPTLALARQAAEQFVIRLMPGDQARIGSFSDRIVVQASLLSVNGIRYDVSPNLFGF